MKTLITLLLLATGALAQNTGQNVVNVSLMRNVANTGTHTYNFPNLHNIGQSSHNVTVTYAAPTGGSAVMTVVIQGSINGINYFNLSPLSQIAATVAGTLQTTGFQSYPYLQAVITASGNVVLSAVYVGNSNPSVVTAENSIMESNLISFSTALFPSGAFVVANGAAGYRIAVYSLSLYSDSGGSLVDLFCGPNSSTVDTTLYEARLAQTSKAEAPSSLRAYGACPVGDGLFINNHAGASALAVNLTLRYE